MEQYDIYDVNRGKTGRTAVRGEMLRPGEYRLVVHVCIFNDKGEMLIQKRSRNKNTWSGLWDVSVGGGAVAGEDSREAAERETLEEIGLSIDLTNIRPRMTVNFKNGFNDVYVIEKNVALSDLTMQEEEVEDLRWADRDEVMDLLAKGTFIPYYKGFLDWVFEARKPRVLFDADKM